MSNKQTAVEWLYSQITFNGLDDPYGDVGKQAKQIEKEQMIEFANKVLYNSCGDCAGNVELIKPIEEIYNETFNHQ